MNVTVIIPTYNGAHKIVSLLKTLEQQTVKDFEVLVVIDGSTDQTSKRLKQQSFSFHSFRLIEQENGGRAVVRNNGARQATGELLIFFDDDMLLPPTCIAEHIKHHEMWPGSILTGGLREPNEGKGSEFSMFKAYLNERWTASFQRVNSLALPKDQPYLTAGNLSVSKELFWKLGGFDERLTDAEDYDLAMRASESGIQLFVNNDAFAWHNELVDCRTYIKRLRQYARAQQKLISIKPELMKSIKRAPVTPKGIKGIVFKWFCHSWWIQSVDKGTWTWLPKTIRFKLYDVIVTANGAFYTDKVCV